MPVAPREGARVESPAASAGAFRDEELLADVITRLIGEVRHIAVGNASPIPAMAALLARQRGRGLPYVSLLQSRKHNFFTDGGRELFDCAGQGRIDVFFLSGGEIDGEGNINLVAIGDYDKPKVRFPGSFGSAHLYYVVPKVVLFRTEHSRRTLVPKVGFISAPGGKPGERLSPGRADRARHQPLPVPLRPRRAPLPARKRASRPHASRRSPRTPASPMTAPTRCRSRERRAMRRSPCCAARSRRSSPRSIRNSPRRCLVRPPPHLDPVIAGLGPATPIAGARPCHMIGVAGTRPYEGVLR